MHEKYRYIHSFIHSFMTRSDCRSIPPLLFVAIKTCQLRCDAMRKKSLTRTQKLSDQREKIWKSEKEETKTNTHQCPLSPVHVQNPWRQFGRNKNDYGAASSRASVTGIFPCSGRLMNPGMWEVDLKHVSSRVMAGHRLELHSRSGVEQGAAKIAG